MDREKMSSSMDAKDLMIAQLNDLIRMKASVIGNLRKELDYHKAQLPKSDDDIQLKVDFEVRPNNHRFDSWDTYGSVLGYFLLTGSEKCTRRSN
jgi:hypothetical protein